MNNEQRTLDAQHSKNINKLTTERSQVDKLKSELKKLEKEYKKLDKKKIKEKVLLIIQDWGIKKNNRRT